MENPLPGSMGLLLLIAMLPTALGVARPQAWGRPHRSGLSVEVTPAGPSTQNDRYTSSRGRIDFVSDAPLESIKAWSNDLRGVLDRSGNFAFSVTMASFEGFNSGLQREHFQENYLEIGRYPKASFEGHIIEFPNLNKPGTYPVRVRGQLTIHGVTRERILPGSLQVMPDKSLEISAEFDVPLQEHNISIPKIMHQKIAESIRVTVKSRLVLAS